MYHKLGLFVFLLCLVFCTSLTSAARSGSLPAAEDPRLAHSHASPPVLDISGSHAAEFHFQWKLPLSLSREKSAMFTENAPAHIYQTSFRIRILQEDNMQKSISVWDSGRVPSRITRALCASDTCASLLKPASKYYWSMQYWLNVQEEVELSWL